MNSLKQYARCYEVPDGALKGIAFWLLPYKTLQVQMAIEYLDAIEPRATYRHEGLGLEQTDKPATLTAAEADGAKLLATAQQKIQVMKLSGDRAAKLLAKAQEAADKLLKACGWTEVYLWNQMHETFVLCLPVTVDIEFPDTAPSVEAAILKDWWANHPSDFAENWQVFKSVLGFSTFVTWHVARSMTQDTVGAALPEMGEDEPDDDFLDADGSASTRATTAS